VDCCGSLRIATDWQGKGLTKADDGGDSDEAGKHFITYTNKKAPADAKIEIKSNLDHVSEVFFVAIMMELSLMALAQAGAALQAQCWIAQDKEVDDKRNRMITELRDLNALQKRAAGTENTRLWQECLVKKGEIEKFNRENMPRGWGRRIETVASDIDEYTKLFRTIFSQEPPYMMKVFLLFDAF